MIKQRNSETSIIPSANSDTQAATASPPATRRNGRRSIRRGLVAISASGATVLAGGFLASSPADASVSPLADYPTFGCTANSINVAEVPLNQGIGTVRVMAAAFVWNGSTPEFAELSPVATVDTDAMFSELADPSFDFPAANNRYFSVAILTSVNGGPWGFWIAQALRDSTNNFICHTV